MRFCEWNTRWWNCQRVFFLHVWECDHWTIIPDAVVIVGYRWNSRQLTVPLNDYWLTGNRAVSHFFTAFGTSVHVALDCNQLIRWSYESGWTLNQDIMCYRAGWLCVFKTTDRLPLAWTITLFRKGDPTMEVNQQAVVAAGADAQDKVLRSSDSHNEIIAETLEENV